jgi:hypothetical protein
MISGTGARHRLAIAVGLAGGLLTLALLACNTPAPTIGSASTSTLAKPADFADYPEAIQQYLSTGGDVATLESALASWGALPPDAQGQVIAADLTGDGHSEIVVALWHAGDEAPSGDLLIFGHQGGQYPLLCHQGVEPYWMTTQLLSVLDTNEDGRPDVVYTLRTCGAHTCFDTLEIVGWEETGFFSLMGGRLDMPYPTYTVSPGRIDALSGQIGSVGAEPQRGYSEVWEWNDDIGIFTVTQEIWEPPTYRYHALLDGDRAMLSSDYATAIAAYERVIGDDALQEWTATPPEEQAQLAAFARWRQVLTYLQDGDLGNAQIQYTRLQADHPVGATGHDAAALAEIFWTAYLADGQIIDGCVEVNAAIEIGGPILDFFNMNYGYANPRWEMVDLCPFVE